MSNVPFLLKCEVFYKSLQYLLFFDTVQTEIYTIQANDFNTRLRLGNAAAVCLSTHKEYKERSSTHKERIKND
jgi:hypothetical protein